MSEYFYGWYFRCQGSEGSAAVIPAVHLSGKKRSCSIQVITQKGSLYREFPIRQFRINREKGILQIGENLFSQKGIRLRFEAASLCSPDGQEKREQKNVPVHGFLRFGQFSEPKYDIMGPFALLPEMECRHAVYSMKHTVSGVLDLNGDILHFQNGLYGRGQRNLLPGAISVAAGFLAGRLFYGRCGLHSTGKNLFYRNTGLSVRKWQRIPLRHLPGSCCQKDGTWGTTDPSGTLPTEYPHSAAKGTCTESACGRTDDKKYPGGNRLPGRDHTDERKTSGVSSRNGSGGSSLIFL